MGLFGRKAKGRHALDAAVTSMPPAPLQGHVPPAAVPAVPVPVAPAAPLAGSPGEPSIMTSIAELIATGEAWAPDVDALEELPRLLAAPVEAPVPALPRQVPAPVPLAPPAPAPRVQLGFRDGTSATLEPGSDQALALEELAQTLTRRD